MNTTQGSQEKTVVMQPGSAPTGNLNADLPSHEALPIGSRLQEFEILDVIGMGGFGIVYKAKDPLLQRLVAVKEYFPATLAGRTPEGAVVLRNLRHADIYSAGLLSFVNEARLLAQFDHPALLKVYRFWEMAGTAYMVMPLYKGQTLAQYKARQPGPLPERQLLDWLDALAGALDILHGQDCYHRDISPDNILIQEDTSQVVLLDFGAARQAITGSTQAFTVILKASYAPIEQHAELPSLAQGPWTDVYALAAVAHFLVTGQTPPQAMGRLVNDNYRPLATLAGLPYHPETLAAIDRALQVQPSERTQSMAEFRHQLAAARAGDAAGQPGRMSTPARFSLFRLPRLGRSTARFTAATAIALVLASLLLVAILFNQDRFGPQDTAQAKSDSKPPHAHPPIQPTDLPQDADNMLNHPGKPVNPAFQAVLDKADQPLLLSMDKTVLKVGVDLLSFQVQSPFDGHVTVHVLSSDGSLVKLLPNSRIPKLTIRAGEPLQLPPTNEPLQAAGPAGINQFLVVVTEQVRSDAHLDLTMVDGFAVIRGQPVALEGISHCRPASCSDRLAASWFPVEEVD